MHRKTTGMVLGKFMPLHKGHELLLNFAIHFVDTLYIVVDNVPKAPIPDVLRCQWVQTLFPHAKVLYIPTALPQHPEEHPDFWHIWKRALMALLPEKPDYIFASEHYGAILANTLESIFIPFDTHRHMVPISGTAIRQAPWLHWDYLSDFAKKYYLKRICLFGPESTGKTTLATQLATHYQTRWVPEYARFYLESKPNLTQEDMLPIAKGQVALEAAIAPMAKQLLFCDTDPLSTVLWSQYLFQSCSENLLVLALQQSCDFYLLMSPDLAWEADPMRYLPEQGQRFFDHCVEILTKHQRSFAVVKGTGEARLHCAIQHIEALISCLA